MPHDEDKAMLEAYRKNATDLSMLALTSTFIPRPTEADFKFGEIRRYFSQQANLLGGEITETSKAVFTALTKKSLFTVVELRWKITGPADDTTDPSTGEIDVRGVRSSNKAAVEVAAKVIPTITNKLTNTLQLWRGF